jgi:hypothetical protein
MATVCAKPNNTGNTIIKNCVRRQQRGCAYVQMVSMLPPPFSSKGAFHRTPAVLVSGSAAKSLPNSLISQLTPNPCVVSALMSSLRPAVRRQAAHKVPLYTPICWVSVLQSSTYLCHLYHVGRVLTSLVTRSLGAKSRMASSCATHQTLSGHQRPGIARAAGGAPR